MHYVLWYETFLIWTQQDSCIKINMINENISNSSHDKYFGIDIASNTFKQDDIQPI